MPILRTARYLLARLETFFVYRVLSLNDTPHRIALGVAIGIFWCWTPTYGIQMILTVLTAWLLRANKLVGVPFVWISNPVTIIPVYGPNLLLGQWILGKPVGNFNALYNAMRADGTLSTKIWNIWHEILPIFWELWVGSSIIATLLAGLSYFAVFRMVVVYRARRQHRMIEHQADERE